MFSRTLNGASFGTIDSTVQQVLTSLTRIEISVDPRMSGAFFQRRARRARQPHRHARARAARVGDDAGRSRPRRLGSPPPQEGRYRRRPGSRLNGSQVTRTRTRPASAGRVFFCRIEVIHRWVTNRPRHRRPTSRRAGLGHPAANSRASRDGSGTRGWDRPSRLSRAGRRRHMAAARSARSPRRSTTSCRPIARRDPRNRRAPPDLVMYASACPVVSSVH
jgi:hypothetical protein